MDFIDPALWKALEENFWGAFAFYQLAAAVVISALLVILVRNIVHAVLWLAVCFVSLAGVFLSLDADFLAAVQVLVYAGAVCIMVVFGIMLIQRNDMKTTNLFNRQVKSAALTTILVLALNIYLALKTQWMVFPFSLPPQDNVGNIAALLLNKYVVPFEVAALLLLVALIGAIVIAKPKEVKADESSTVD